MYSLCICFLVIILYLAILIFSFCSSSLLFSFSPFYSFWFNIVITVDCLCFSPSLVLRSSLAPFPLSHPPFFSLLSTPHSSPCSLFPILLFTLSYPFFFLLIQSHTHKKNSSPLFLTLPTAPLPSPPSLPSPSHSSPHPLPPFPLCVKESNGMFYGEERMERPPPNISCPSHAFTQYSIANV